MGTKLKKRSLAEELTELSNPRPLAYHPDLEDLDDLTAAKVCSFSGEEEEELDIKGASRGKKPIRSRRKVKYLDEEDVKYAGRAISRKDLDEDIYNGQMSDAESSESTSELEASLVEDYLTVENKPNIISVDSDVSFDQSDKDDTSSDKSSSASADEQEPSLPVAGGDDITMMSLASLQEDVVKGKAAKEQVALFDGALEARIRLQKLLTACNRLPQPETTLEFHKAGGQQLEQALKESQVKLKSLLDNLLGLQKLICSKNKETHSIVGGASNSSHGNDEEDSDEEISSDFEEEGELQDDVISSQSESEEAGGSESTSRRLKRKRKRPEWVTLDGKRDYEGYNGKTHERFRPFRDSTIEKWSKRTKIASGKITSKAFMQVDHSILSQIEHVLKDRERLVKRTQLKRSVYRVLGTSDEAAANENENGTSERTEDGVTDEERGVQDTHLRDYDQEIFDDDDFYHQLLRELIERKINYTESSDPTAMGRQWLELQKLRNKAKKKVDTKASKGRKIRYDIHPKLTNFMAPVNKGSMTDVSKNDLFGSLFGGRCLT